MENPKKLLNKIFVISTLIFFIVGAFILFAPNKKRMEALDSLPLSATEVPHTFAAGSNSLLDSPSMVSYEKFDYCRTLREKIPPIEEWKKTQPVSERFVNVHKRVNGTIFRLRFFYKEHAEGDTPTYLLYIEDPDEVAHLIEKSGHKKGKEFTRIENGPGEIIYTEKGINVGEEESLLLHYVNSKLKGFQGTIPELDSKAFIDCRF